MDGQNDGGQDNPQNNNGGNWYEAETLDHSLITDKVKGFTNADGTMNVGELLKSYNAAQSMIGGSVKIPTEKSTDEERAAFYRKLGCPETTAGYDWKEPEGIEVKGEAFETFKKNALALGLTNKQLSGVLDGYTNIVKELHSQALYANAQQEKDTREKLGREWGDKFDGKLDGVMKLLEKAGIKDDLASLGRLYDERYIRLFHQITEDSRSGSLKGGDMTSDEITARMNAIKADPAYLNAALDSHAALVKEFNELCALKAKA